MNLHELLFLIIGGISLILIGCTVSTKPVVAKVENVKPGIIITDKGHFICGNCLAVIRSQTKYKFILEGNRILQMEEIKK